MLPVRINKLQHIHTFFKFNLKINYSVIFNEEINYVIQINNEIINVFYS